jgi:uncharacterized membrane protein
MESNSGIDRLGTRLQSLDILRGAIMVLMAIDHVRVYSGLPAGGPSAGIFFTRWITHFCAPGFVFLAGTSAFLYGSKINDKGKLIRFLVMRGLLLVLLELTVIRFSWTFNFDYANFLLAGVIWMLGWCMVLLAVFVRLRPVWVGILGLAIICFQQVFSFFPRILPATWHDPIGRVWEFVYPSGTATWPGITILYVLVPWIGVMAAGYGFGALMKLESVKRNKICLQIGLSAIFLFLVAGSLVIFFQPADPHGTPFIFQLLGQRKYPASVLYLLMTLGPLVALIPLAEKAGGWLKATLSTFGSVPMFYYLAHIPLIHITALVVNLIREGNTGAEFYATAPYVFMPEVHQWSLPLLYLVFVIDVAILFFFCRWYSAFKSVHPEIKWLKYI